MHTLSVFPGLLDYAQVAPLFLRVVLAIILSLMAYRSFRAKLGDAPLFSPATFQGTAWIHLLELAAGVLLFVGLITQLAALATIIFMIIRWGTAKTEKTDSFSEKALYTIIAAAAVALMFFGAGFFAFDLPL